MDRWTRVARDCIPVEITKQVWLKLILKNGGGGGGGLRYSNS